MLPQTKIEELISISAIKAICADAGYPICTPEVDNGFDGYIEDTVYDGINKYSPSGIQIQFQAKATYNVTYTDTHIEYSLKNKNYNTLVNSFFPTRILILFVLPKEREEWVKILDGKIEIRNCVYYINLYKHGPIKENINSYTKISIPRANILTKDAIDGMIKEQLKARRIIEMQMMSMEKEEEKNENYYIARYKSIPACE